MDGRQQSNLFNQLTDYQDDYRPKAFRYNVGEHSHFIQMPMLEVALREKSVSYTHLDVYKRQTTDRIAPN